MEQNPLQTPESKNSTRTPWFVIVILLVILVVGAYFRYIGLNWDSSQHLHPDERFLTMVSSSLSSVKSIGEFFDTAHSTLNPQNVGYGFFVYGTLPIFIVRYAAEAINQTGYDQIFLVGRALSATADLGTILLTFLIALRLFKKNSLALIAAAFMACAVLPIQMAHYFTVESYLNFFVFLTFYFGVRIITKEPEVEIGAEKEEEKGANYLPDWLRLYWKTAGLYVLFGAAFGAAMACKVSAAPEALLLPGAAYLYWLKVPTERKDEMSKVLIRNLVLGGIVALLAFRIFQPYAFTGPSFFNFSLDKNWISSLEELSQQSSGNVDFPPALQWARRPLTFSFTNLVLWGVGLPLGILAWASFLWMGYKIFFRKEYYYTALLWGWTGAYFIWQSVEFTRSMRYQIPIYPALCIIAAWGIVTLWQTAGKKLVKKSLRWLKPAAVIIGVVSLTGTLLWAFAFTRIYTRPLTRVAASEWIYQNIPGAINLSIQTRNGEEKQPIAYPNGSIISPGTPYIFGFSPESDSTLVQVSLEHVLFTQPQGKTVTLLATIYQGTASTGTAIASGYMQSNFAATDDPRGPYTLIQLNAPVPLKKGEHYEVKFDVVELGVTLQIMGNTNLIYDVSGKMLPQELPDPVYALKTGTAYPITFVPTDNGTISEIDLNRIVDLTQNNQVKTLSVDIFDNTNPNQILASGTISDTFMPVSDPRGQSKVIPLDHSITLDHTHAYTMQFTAAPLADGSSAALGIYNNSLATESSWDDALPLSLNGYNIWDYVNGIFGNAQNFEMYWPDNQTKLNRFTSILDTTDTIVISSNRQWATTTRLPERYPLTSAYYRNLLGCPEGADLLWCYQVAQPGMFSGNLGFKLTAVFESDPNIGSFKINDQSSEEAFTVYDHPKVFIFQKTADFNPAKVLSILGAVDLNNVISLTPAMAGKFKGTLMLSDASLKIQQAGGTFIKLFDPKSLVNENQWAAAAIWYLLILLLGWMVYPATRLALKKLPDHGYPVSRLVGLLLLALLTWWASSSGATFSRETILAVLGFLLIANAALAWYQRKELVEEFKKKKWYFLIVEVLFFLFFLLDLGIRYGNPDLWHPWKGGEKPMDLSFFTAVLKSTTFPPYDPWFAGGYINYYYYGYVIVGVPTRLLGIQPTVAYNLILPTLFGMTAMGAFSVGWNLISGLRNGQDQDERRKGLQALAGGLVSAIFVLILGNLGTLRMIWQGAQALVAPNGNIETATLIQRWGWFFDGMLKFFQGTKLPYGTGDWYWIPSRAIPGETITEFPFFTFIYGDLHAHMIALPITLLAIGWGISILLGRWKWGENRKDRIFNFTASILLGGIVIGALRPTNTWDLPTYMVLSSLLIIYTVIRYAEVPGWFLPKMTGWLRKWLFAAGAVVLLVALSFAFYIPFSRWYGQAYGSVDPWTGDHTPPASYLTHWGFFLFIVVSWLTWETRDWMAKTPVSALKRLKKYGLYLQVVAVLFVMLLVILALIGVDIVWFALPIGIWALVLILRPDQPDVKRLILFMIGTAMVLTLFVELFALHGDIGRMNTVFKFYYQAWTMLALSSAAGLIWLIPAVNSEWNRHVSAVWQIIFAFLLFGALLYPLTAAQDKIDDRMSQTAPHTLNGMTYMKTSFYSDQNTTFDLSQDYDGIKWMQQNIQGSPVIVEGNTVEYKWGTRYTIYTGLPGVVGWNFHERQQRGYIDDSIVWDRINEIPVFYQTTDIQTALDFIKKYNVQYIVVGQLEEAYYPGEGLNKFTQYNGVYWKQVFHEKDTTIYQVIPAQ